MLLLVRVRPFSEREQSQLTVALSTTPFVGDGSLAPAASTSQLLNAHRSASSGVRQVIRVLDDRVLVFDPKDTNPVTPLQRQLLGTSYKKGKDIRFCFDHVFDSTATQQDVYQGTAMDLVDGVLSGINSTVFAYGVRPPCPRP